MKIQKIDTVTDQHMALLLLADPSEELVQDYLNRGTCFALDVHHQPIGVLVLVPTRPKTLEIMNIAVDPAHQGKGYAKKLIQFAIRLAQKHGFFELEIGTGNNGFGQLALYQKCGFRMTSIDRDFFIRHYPEKIFENGIQCMDMVRLSLSLNTIKENKP